VKYFSGGFTLLAPGWLRPCLRPSAPNPELLLSYINCNFEDAKIFWPQAEEPYPNPSLTMPLVIWRHYMWRHFRPTDIFPAALLSSEQELEQESKSRSSPGVEEKNSDSGVESWVLLLAYCLNCKLLSKLLSAHVFSVSVYFDSEEATKVINSNCYIKETKIIIA